MLYNRQFLLVVFSAFVLQSMAQNVDFNDTIQSSSSTAHLELHFNLPLGQLLVTGPSSKPGISGIRCYSPNPGFQAKKTYRTLGARRIISFIPVEEQVGMARQAASNSGENSISYRISNTSLSDAGNVLWEYFPDPNMPHSIFIQSGMGSSRLDLSGLKITGLNVSSGASDVIISYSKPNLTEMDVFEVNGGMGKIVVRNLEMARAKKVHIQNGLGETQISIGSSCTIGTEITVEVGAGSCTITADSDVPMKIIISKSFMSSIHIPESFLQTGENIYVNPKYKTSENQSVVIFADIGIGDFTFLPSGK